MSLSHWKSTRDTLGEDQVDRKNPPPRGGFVFTMFPHQEPWGVHGKRRGFSPGATARPSHSATVHMDSRQKKNRNNFRFSLLAEPARRIKLWNGSTWNARELGDNIDHESQVKGMRSKLLAKKSEETQKKIGKKNSKLEKNWKKSSLQIKKTKKTAEEN